jgi:hypothetical protein
MPYYINAVTQRVVQVSTTSTKETSAVYTLYDTKEEAEAFLMSVDHLADLMELQSKGSIFTRPSPQQYKRIAALLECLKLIHTTMDVDQWDSETSQNVSELLTSYDLPIRDFNPGEGNCIACGEPETSHDPHCPIRIEAEGSPNEV